VAGARDNGPNLRDFYIAKLNSTGSLEWEEMFGGTEIDYALEVIQTSDNGYVLMGNTSSNDGDVTNNQGGIDLWVVKLDNDGDLQWERSLGGSGDDFQASIQLTVDGGYIVAAASFSADGDVTENYGGMDIWVVKLDPAGAIQWERSYGGSDDDLPGSIR